MSGRATAVQSWVNVVAVCGMPGSGKGEFAAVLDQAGVPVVSMGDMIRAEVRQRGLEEEPHVFGEVAAELSRSTRRGRVWRFACASAWTNCSSTIRWCSLKVCVERPRMTRCFSTPGGAPLYRTMAIIADAELRFQRTLQQRGRSEDGDRAAFEARNETRTGVGGWMP